MIYIIYYLVCFLIVFFINCIVAGYTDNQLSERDVIGALIWPFTLLTFFGIIIGSVIKIIANKYIKKN